MTTLAKLAESGSHSGAAVLDSARANGFTGELAFAVEPAVSVYFDGGVAYHAVRTGDPSLCDRLIEADVIGPAQVERGVIRVGSVENLGRLFDRDPSIDRDSVLVVLELATADVVNSVAAETCEFSINPYRHHASGVHRWFVAPAHSLHRRPSQLSPIGQVAQIDTSVTTDLPGVGERNSDKIEIEWDGPVDDLDLDAESTPAPTSPAPSATAAAPVVAESIEAPTAAAGASDASTAPADDARVDAGDPDGDPLLSFVMPDLSIGDTNSTDTAVDSAAGADTEATTEADEVVDAVRRALEAIEVASSSPTQLQSVDMDDIPSFEPTGPLHFDAVDPLTADDATAADADVEVDVITADELVAQARDAQHAAEAQPTHVDGVDAADVAHNVAAVETDTAEIETAEIETAEIETAATGTVDAETDDVAEPVAAPAFGAFAPPRLEDAAEVMFARQAAEAAAAAQAAAEARAAVEEPAPASGVASVVFVDEDPDESNERTGALQRLIGNIRRK